MLNVKIEVFKPYRKIVQEMQVDDSQATIQEINSFVDGVVKANIQSYVNRCPEATEIRWEYVEFGQGHYITVEQPRPFAWVGALDTERCKQVLRRAIDIEDWVMAEDVSYALKLMKRFDSKLSGQEFVLRYDNYNFTWMTHTDDVNKPSSQELPCVVCGELFIDVPDECGCNVCSDCSEQAENLHGKITEVVKCDTCGKTVRYDMAMIMTGEYGQKDIARCYECIDKQLNDNE